MAGLEPLPDIVTRNARDMIGTGPVATENDILQAALAVQQIHDPNGPRGDEYLNLQYFCARHTGALIRRILQADSEIKRLRNTNNHNHTTN